jgi:bile acid:Na+ symporter, BASS family
VTEALLLALKVSIATMLCAIGMGSTLDDLGYLFRRPALLLRSLLAMYVAVPLAVLGLVRALPLPPGVRTAVLVLAISAGAPLLPRKLVKLGREGYVFSLVVLSSLLAVLAVPAWLALLGPFFVREPQAGPGTVGVLVAKAALGPLLAGMLLRPLLGERAGRISEGVLKLVGVALLVAAAGLLVLHGHLLFDADPLALPALAGVTVVGLAIGHALGGPDREDRTALAVTCATRHVGVAMLAASAVPNPRVIALVLAYLVCAALVTLPYLRWRRRPAAAATARPRPSAAMPPR